MWCIYEALEFFNSMVESFPDQFVPSFFFGDDQHDRLNQPLLDQAKGEHRDDFNGVEHRFRDKKASTRVRVKMTKEEARRLVAKCKDQKGTLEFREVALELVKIPPHRILEVTNIESSTATYPSSLWGWLIKGD